MKYSRNVVRMQPGRGRPGQLRGWWDDRISEGADWVRSKAGEYWDELRRPAPTAADHIAQQNATVAEFARILDAVQLNQLSRTVAAGRIESLTREFERYAAAFGSRGLAGAADVRRLANDVIRGLNSAAPAGGGYYPPAAAGSSYLPWMLGAGVLFFALRRR